MTRIVFSAGLLAGLLAAGCGKSGGPEELVPVAGNITVDGNPAGNVVVTYIPQGDTKGNGGEGMTDSTGRYEVTTPKGKKGLLPGKYKVVASRRLNPDGSPADPNTPPIESNARETLPKKYTDQEKTELSVTLSPGDKRSFDFALTSEKEKKK